MAEAPKTASRCPKCDEPVTVVARYCDGGDGAGLACSHKQQSGEHLYQRCQCGYEYNFRPCADAKKETENVSHQ